MENPDVVSNAVTSHHVLLLSLQSARFRASTLFRFGGCSSHKWESVVQFSALDQCCYLMYVK